jgi:hypothetical protein
MSHADSHRDKEPGNTMNSQDYLTALDRLQLTPYTAALHLGISRRQSHRYASGDSPVNPTIVLLLQMYLKFGLPGA